MLTNVFGLPVRYDVWDKQGALPLYISGNYQFRVAYIMEKRCIMLKPEAELASLPALKKQIEKIQIVDPAPVVLDLEKVSFYRRKNLIENNIPFVTPKQVFLPFLGTMLMNETEVVKPVEKFMFSTQQLFLLYLYSNQKRLYVSDAGKKLPFTAMTLTRAVKQLEATDFFFITKDGVNKVMESKYNRLELFKKSQKYLADPVRKKGYIEKSQITSKMVLAGETALSEKTMLNPSRIITYAISDKEFDKKNLMDELVDPEKQVKLELWAYDPGMFSKDKIADSLSVMLSLRENEDERIEEAIEELTEREMTEYW